MYTKSISPAFTKVGKRNKLTGYLGQLYDGETLIHSMEYSTNSQAEQALDALAFEILSDLAEQGLVDELPAFEPTTCVYCHKPHAPAHCPEKNALLFAPDADNSFAVTQKTWAEHECNGDSDVCSCQFAFNCTSCGKKQTVSGEEIPQYIDTGGKCEACYYEVNEMYAPLDVDFAPCGPEV